MFVILDGEAEFTVNGRTSTIQAPAIVPCKIGSSHAIYNPTGEPITWLNFAVSREKAKGDAFDLNDTREGAGIDPIPVFVSSRLEKEKLRNTNTAYEGSDVQFRRILGPEVFATDWHHVDHLMFPSGSSSSPRKMEGLEEVYYVVKGNGKLNIGGERVDVKAHDAFFANIGEEISLSNEGNEDLELLVIGIFPSKTKKNQAIQTPAMPKAMVLQMDFVVEKDKAEAFEKMYHSIYVPAMTVQQGYLESKLLKLYPEATAKEIEAEETTFNYQIQISFDTEENRRKWVASKQHDIAWPAATDLVKDFKWRGYDVKGADNMP
jgi:mannose-6-phosphate isomerase-like protein (cupin superfamily)